MLEELEQVYKNFFRNYDRYKRHVNFFGNVVIFVMAVYVVSDIEGFKNSIECKTWKPVVDVAKTCPYGVRTDMCFFFYDQNVTFTPYHALNLSFLNASSNKSYTVPVCR
jgi:hypothetical protein